MGGTPCVIIILGNELQGDIAGIYESFSEAQPYLTEDEKKEIKNFLILTKSTLDSWLNTVRQSGNIELDIISLGAQVAGNLSGVCDTAVDSKLSDEQKKSLAAFLDGQKRTAEKILKLMRERAEKDKD